MSSPAWHPESWKAAAEGPLLSYEGIGAGEVAAATARLRALPPLVTSWEVERLRGLLADAQAGRRFLLQGGDCAETLDGCTSGAIASKLKILLQMSLVLVQGLKRPVIRVGRIAGQYAKPRSSPTETRVVDGRSVTLPSYFGELYNGAEFTPEARRLDPGRMIRGHEHAAMTLNFVRALVDGGFADLHHPEYWDLSFLRQAGLAAPLRAEYERITANLGDGLRFMEAFGEATIQELSRVEFYTSHEALNLHYESALARQVPRREGVYGLSAHLLWIGERTRGLRGAHVEFARGLRNPVGVKVGPGADAEEIAAVVRRLDPAAEPGKVLLITRLGAGRAADVLPRLVRTVGPRPVLWVCDPMHGNGMVTAGGVKTRSFDAVRQELAETIEAHAAAGTRLGGVHFELTGEDVTECLGGAAGVTQEQLSTRYASVCDPRLNYQQSLELAFSLAHRLSAR
ncbi:MAG: 3-deoxy-7-phosphoheptulonate synthase [Phycisphaerales bacterium]|nr:3-deoxy-7-phosphoheptulonate synthase [Phycisphaerales bacterium]